MKFKCQESCGGKCCTNSWASASFVFLTRADRIRIEAFKENAIEDWCTRYAFDTTRFAKFKTHQWVIKNKNGNCPFFKDGKCGIYEIRPIQCKTFPYWPENFANQEALKKICPGIGEGDSSKGGELLDLQIEADEELRKNRCR